MRRSLASPANMSPCRPCSIPFTTLRRPPATARSRRYKMPVKATSSPSEKLTEIQDALKLRQVKLQQLVEQEEYQQAAQQRDAITQLELDRRRLELEAQQEAYESIVHDIGQVIRHKRYEYKGVIIGFDPACVASESWIKAMRVDALPRGRSQPFYHVLVDSGDRHPPGDVTYVAEENIATIRGQQQVKHPLIDTYFSGFEDGQYVPTETVRKKYPARPSKASD